MSVAVGIVAAKEAFYRETGRELVAVVLAPREYEQAIEEASQRCAFQTVATRDLQGKIATALFIHGVVVLEGPV